MLWLSLYMFILAAAPTPIPARSIWHPDIGNAWRDALPETKTAPLFPERDLAVITDAATYERLRRALPRGQAPAFDPRRDVAIVLVARIASELELHGVVREGKTAVVQWGPSPFYVAFEPPQILVVVFPRAGIEAIVLRDITGQTQVRQMGPLPLP